MALLYPVLSILESLFAGLLLWKPAESGGISRLRLIFMILIALIVVVVLSGWLFRSKILRRSEKIGTACFFLSAACFFIAFTTRFYFDNPALDFTVAYLKQALPFILLTAILSLQTFIGIVYYYSKEDGSVSRAFKQLFWGGRIVWQVVLIFLACLTLMSAFIPIRANYYPSFDSSIFSYIGQQILRGKLPYVDGWDHKPPLIFYIDAFGLWLANGHLIGIWLLEVIALLLGSILFFRILKKYFSEGIALSVTMLGILHQARLFDFGNYTEEFSLFFQLAAFSLAFSDRFRNRLGWQGFLSGVLCGLAFTCKQNTVGLWAALFLLDILQLYLNRDQKSTFVHQVIYKWVRFLIGFLAVNGIWIVYFAVKGILREYWDVAFVYNFVYAQKSGESRWATGLTTLTFLPSLSVFLLLAFLSWPAALFDRIRSLRQCNRNDRQKLFDQNRLLLFALIALPVELILAGLSGMNYQHYFILCVPSACILAAWLGDSMLRQLSVRMKPVAASLVVLAVFWIGSAPMANVYRRNYEPRMPSAATKTADFLNSNTDDGDLVQLWGGVLAPYVMSERSSPSRFFNVRPLYLFPGYMQEEQWGTFLADLKNSPPKFIVYMNDRFLAQVPYNSNGFCEDLDLADYQRPTYQFLCDHYRYRETINEGMNDAWGVFERTGKETK